MNDDEGTYLYAAWRTGLGEVPYRDFTVVQTPLAMAATEALFRLTGPSFFAARALSLLCVLGAAVLLYRAVRFRLRLPAGIALAAAGIFLLNKHVFFLARSFMPDNLMLLCAAAALGAMLRAESGTMPTSCGSRAQDRVSKQAAFLAGLFSGLAALAKLNGAIFLIGYGVYLGLGLLRRKTRCAAWANAWRAAAGFGLGFGLPFGLMLALVPDSLRYTLGFHAAGGAEAGCSAALVAARLGKLVGNHNYGLFLPALAGIWVLLRCPGGVKRGRALALRSASPPERRSSGGIELTLETQDATPTQNLEKLAQRRNGRLLVAVAAAACLPVLLPGKYDLPGGGQVSTPEPLAMVPAGI